MQPITCKRVYFVNIDSSCMGDKASMDKVGAVGKGADVLGQQRAFERKPCNGPRQVALATSAA